ncbi:hypothetical protein ACJMK2_015735 [Sinanodonta woodiana]|uniref:SGNH hydrolase-type esterase domain-containing protein n=1 Tax=Sinanodonta woodiana TaxID=1069815 RepID=A0ABD3UTD9_SINWO
MTKALIMGHSLCKWLDRFLRFGTDPRLVPSFNIAEVCKVNMKGVGGRTIDKLLRQDMGEVRLRRPDIVVLIIGDNDVKADTSPEVIAHKIVALGTLLHRKYRVKHVVLCQLMPRFTATLRQVGVSKIHNRNSVAAGKNYKDMYCQLAKEVNDIVRSEVLAYPYLTFWEHKRKFAFDRPQVREKFRSDGIHLSPKGQWHLYKSLRGALINACYKISHKH